MLGQKLAIKYGIFHVAFRDYLQEQILSKLKQPPLVDVEDWEGPESEQQTGIDNTRNALH